MLASGGAAPDGGAARDGRRRGRLARRLASMTLILFLAAAAILAAGQLHFLDIAYEKAFGPPDLGPIAFGRLVRRWMPNDALACPPGECGSAAVDVRPSSYPSTANELRRRVRRFFLEQGASLVGSDDTAQHDRFVVRTKLMRFPDTVDVEIFAIDAEHATLAVYSRSQLGYYDFGTNLRRVRALLEALGPGVAAA
jgi:uncharacterized protein (DUF1499 family)